MVQLAKPKVTVLFTSVGRRVELLQAFRQALQRLDLAGQIVATDIDPLAPALQLADRTYLVPRLTAPDYVPTLTTICQREGVDLIFPLIDPDIPVLASHRATLEATGAHLGVCGCKAVETAADKWQTTQFFQQLGITTPRSWLPGQIDADEITYPVFIKPRRGSAAKSTFKVNNARELAFFSDYVPDPIIQEYLPGAEITNDVVCDLRGQVLGIASRQRIEVRWGEVAKGVTVHQPAIIEACTTIAQALPAIGPITVQCILKNNVPHFTEINARFGGGLPLAIEAGLDAPGWLLAKAAGLPCQPPPVGAYQVGLYMTRYDDTFFLNETQREQMASHRL